MWYTDWRVCSVSIRQIQEIHQPTRHRLATADLLSPLEEEWRVDTQLACKQDNPRLARTFPKYNTDDPNRVIQVAESAVQLEERTEIGEQGQQVLQILSSQTRKTDSQYEPAHQ